MTEGDLVNISTKKKEKSVTLTSNGVVTNIIGNLKAGSTWFQLNPGDNAFTTNATDGPENMDVTCIVINQFEGV
jgi:hypothetical protein